MHENFELTLSQDFHINVTTKVSSVQLSLDPEISYATKEVFSRGATCELVHNME